MYCASIWAPPSSWAACILNQWPQRVHDPAFLLHRFVFSSKKYVLTLVPIFVVCPALAFILWLTRHRIARWLPCCKKAAAAALADKDGAKVEDANGEFFQVFSIAQIKLICKLGK